MLVPLQILQTTATTQAVVDDSITEKDITLVEEVEVIEVVVAEATGMATIIGHLAKSVGELDMQLHVVITDMIEVFKVQHMEILTLTVVVLVQIKVVIKELPLLININL